MPLCCRVPQLIQVGRVRGRAYVVKLVLQLPLFQAVVWDLQGTLGKRLYPPDGVIKKEEIFEICACERDMPLLFAFMLEIY